MPVRSARVTLNAGEQPHQHPIKTVLDRRARAARSAHDRHAAGTANQQQIAGVDRHAEMLDGTADPRNRGRDHVAAIGDGRRSEHDNEFGAKAKQLLDRGSECGLLMRHPALGDDRSTSGREPLGGDAQRLVDHLWRKSRQQCRDDADLANRVGRNAQRILAGHG